MIKPLRGDETTLASSTIYSVNISSSNLPPCEEVTCNIEHSLFWHGNDVCTGDIVCPKLRENPCEDFGLTIALAENEMIDVCTENKVHRGGLGPHEAFVQNLWYAKGAVFSIQCYFWCNDEGIVPKRHHDSEASSESLTVLVSGNVNLPKLVALTLLTDVCISSSTELCP